jgi:hypothetical protein
MPVPIRTLLPRLAASLATSLAATLATALAAVLAACAGGDPTSPHVASAAAPAARALLDGGGDAPAERLPAEVARRQLERAAEGLLFMSESDHPFTYVRHLGPASSPLTVEAFRTAVGVPPDVPVEVVSLDEFLARHIERVDPADPVAVALVPRYRQLRETLRRVVRAPRVYRVGRIAITCYLVGTDASDDVVGLTTVAIET